MSRLKRIGLAMCLAIFLALAFRAFLFRAIVQYEAVGERKFFAITDQKLKSALPLTPEPDAQKIIDETLSFTCDQLRFTTAKNEIDPNRLIQTKTAHCVGYATFFSTVCNDQFRKANLTDWVAIPQIGKLYVFGNDIHRYFKSPFFKDHDFVIVKNRKTGQTIAVDPTLSDYLWIDSVRIKSD